MYSKQTEKNSQNYFTPTYYCTIPVLIRPIDLDIFFDIKMSVGEQKYSLHK